MNKKQLEDNNEKNGIPKWLTWGQHIQAIAILNCPLILIGAGTQVYSYDMI